MQSSAESCLSHAGAAGRAGEKDGPPLPRAIAWELTRRCPMSCRHCRGAARNRRYEGELSTAECMRLLEGIASFSRPMIILTGGEPMLRPDIYEIASRGTGLGLRMVMAPCGFLVDETSVSRMLESGIKHISISLDGASAESHDAFRGREGAFRTAVQSMRTARRASLGFQVNTTVSRHNNRELPRLLELAVELGASAFNPFMLVPTGRGRELADLALDAHQQEEVLRWLAFQSARDDIRIRVTCGPHYQRVLRQVGMRGPCEPERRAGCLGGKSFAFISHTGRVQICGFLERECGDVRAANYDFERIWRESELFRRVRDEDSYGGDCGRCRYRVVCGGCRARANASTGDYMAEEPGCAYSPPGTRGGPEAAGPGRYEKHLLTAVQKDFPLRPRPFEELAERLESDPERVLDTMRRLRTAGYIRRVGAVFDSRRLGFVSTLVAGRVPPERLREVARRVNRLPGVTHNYRRSHEYNLWFTLRAASRPELERTLDQLRKSTGIAELHSLPAVRTYNRSVTFDLVGGSHSPAGQDGDVDDSPPHRLDEQQVRLARVLQDDLPLVRRPYRRAAQRAGWREQDALAQIRRWQSQGLLRRVAAIVRHRRLGLRANGMAVFAVPDGRADEAGRGLARRPEVSHCYRREAFPGWPYELFAMVHGDSREKVLDCADRFARELDCPDYEVLFSVEQYKKTSPRLF